MAKHPCIDYLEGRLSFSHPKCTNCTEEGLSKIQIDYDERIIEESGYWDSVRVCGVVTMGANGPVIDVNVVNQVLEGLPKEYRKHIRVFDGSLAQELPLDRKWDHAIDLKEGTQPP